MISQQNLLELGQIFRPDLTTIQFSQRLLHLLALKKVKQWFVQHAALIKSAKAMSDSYSFHHNIFANKLATGVIVDKSEEYFREVCDLNNEGDTLMRVADKANKMMEDYIFFFMGPTADSPKNRQHFREVWISKFGVPTPLLQQFNPSAEVAFISTGDLFESGFREFWVEFFGYLNSQGVDVTDELTPEFFSPHFKNFKEYQAENSAQKIDQQQVQEEASQRVLAVNKKEFEVDEDNGVERKGEEDDSLMAPVFSRLAPNSFMTPAVMARWTAVLNAQDGPNRRECDEHVSRWWSARFSNRSDLAGFEKITIDNWPFAVASHIWGYVMSCIVADPEIMEKLSVGSTYKAESGRIFLNRIFIASLRINGGKKIEGIQRVSYARKAKAKKVRGKKPSTIRHSYFKPGANFSFKDLAFKLDDSAIPVVRANGGNQWVPRGVFQVTNESVQVQIVDIPEVGTVELELYVRCGSKS